LEKIERAVVGGVQGYSKTITYNFSFPKKELANEIFKNIKGST
jgi:hypothetical protein